MAAFLLRLRAFAFFYVLTKRTYKIDTQLTVYHTLRLFILLTKYTYRLYLITVYFYFVVNIRPIVPGPACTPTTGPTG